jgi:ferredoxin
MAKIPVVDDNACIGCTACVGVCPGVFRMNAQNKSEAYNAQGDTEENIQHAIDVCPVQAISWKK